MSQRNPKAEGMQWLNTYITVKDVKGSLEFYEKAFGFKTRMTMPDKEGNIMHAEMGHKDSVIMVGPEGPNTEDKAPSEYAGKGVPVSFYLYVDDVGQSYEKAKQAGAKELQPVKDQFWGDRTCTFSCPEGHKWTLAQNVADFDPSKIPF